MQVFTMIAEHPVVPGVIVRTFKSEEARAAVVAMLKREAAPEDRDGMIFELFESLLED